MKVRLTRNGRTAFALIDDQYGACSIKLDDGMTAGASLRKYAEQQRKRAERLLTLAKRAELASELI